MKILKAIFVVISWIVWLIAMAFILVLGAVLDALHFIVDQTYWALVKATRFVTEDWTTKMLAYSADEPLEKIKEEWKGR